MRVIRMLGVWAAVAALAVASTAEEPSGSPSHTVDGLHEVLIDVMKNADTLGYEGRTRKLEPAIPEYYDVAFMAEKSVGRHWRKATEQERERFLATFLRFMVANYAGQFDGYSGQHFETLSEEPARLDTVLVKSVLVNPEGDDVELNYRMRQVDGRWKVIDVYLDGTVSELALRRSEFSGIVKREDFDALIAAIDERIEKLASGTES
ncbi:MAG: ABC transporter substrate-binding protein [Myxococcota bacterium]